MADPNAEGFYLRMGAARWGLGLLAVAVLIMDTPTSYQAVNPAPPGYSLPSSVRAVNQFGISAAVVPPAGAASWWTMKLAMRLASSRYSGFPVAS